MWKWLVICLSVGVITACEQRTTLAPVVEANWRASNIAATHRVQRGETMYSIAFRYDQDYRQLAAINRIPRPYLLAVGQVIHLKPSQPQAMPRPVYAPRKIIPARTWHPQPQSLKATNRAGAWLWPAQGAILTSFSPQQGKKGIDIAGKAGQSIRATANGTVAYAGDGLPGYGNLILIKHDNQFLSAYGYNARNLVREGQVVRAGQVIALMGMSPNRRNAVHFELRKAGQPTNPRYFLH